MFIHSRDKTRKSACPNILLSVKILCVKSEHTFYLLHLATLKISLSSLRTVLLSLSLAQILVLVLVFKQ
ncbi:hypothetical protein PGTUg99_007165 [Puccinia graminis f. sp. tritici]|uniref:Uncharacterized protein n=1 Tax=Puccinia graminis f. sp. tritici TaxID=56615 RepID=A0A5B0M4K3_PUCGR|nr:hypothetical protein PGTUg99_007165 [Puccinia graminis f. sp. tritici]